ncbi:hypothetical protein NBRC3299_1564 [Acetobacter pasteurianus NBRC 3299]|nr:hypothetical protein BBA71_07350 [Acetobacter pasteurianus]GCD75272.1 hypothetical protein NBRC3299_1564 [Acetobacter pasteurianus NBRC 3299]
MSNTTISGTGNNNYTVVGGEILTIDTSESQSTDSVLLVNIEDYDRKEFNLIITGQNMGGLYAYYDGTTTVISQADNNAGAYYDTTPPSNTNGTNYDVMSKWASISTWISIPGNPFNLTAGSQPIALGFMSQNTTSESDTNTATFDDITAACFLAGSMIATPSGDVCIENMRVGEEVVVFDWKSNKTITKQVIWVGKAHAIVRAEMPDDEAGYPIRILKNAIAQGVPYKDMLITPEHCLFFDGQFVPARMLVNGKTVFYDKSITSYNYYHIETDEHSVVVADGVFTESYLDTGNRNAFQNSASVIRVTFNPKNWEKDAAAPLVTTVDVVEPLYRHLEKRADDAGVALKSALPVLTHDPDLHLVTDKGTIIRQVRTSKDHAIFMIPANVQNVHLVSRASRPSDTVGPFVDDRRMLGVMVGVVSLLSGGTTYNITAHLEQDNLSVWHTQEEVLGRWTDGNALLPLNGHKVIGFGMLSVQILSSGAYVLSENTVQKKELSA